MAPEVQVPNNKAGCGAFWGRELLSRTPSLRKLMEPLARAVADKTPVLLTGESGTGKTHLAQLIHDHSWRNDHGLVVVSCAALSPSEQASTLFGHVRNAFPGADGDQAGKFQTAGQGTILLEDVEALGPEQHAQLLRVLQTGEFNAFGSSQRQYCRAR